MQRLKTLALAGTAAVACTSIAGAADWPGSSPLPPIEKAPALVQEFASGWYIRGDVGYRFNQASGGAAFGTNFDGNSVDNSFAFGGGFGVKSGWFRTDITLDYMMPPRFTGTSLGTTLVTSEIAAYTTLVNGYVDLGTWSGFSPYIGAGVGASFLRTGDFNAVFPGPNAIVSHPGEWDFAWAAMAGVAYTIYPNLLVDIGYRYLHMGAARTDVNPYGSVTYGDLSANEIRVGLRYLLD